MACMPDADEDRNMQRARDPDSLTVDDSGYIVASYQHLTGSHSCQVIQMLSQSNRRYYQDPLDSG